MSTFALREISDSTVIFLLQQREQVAHDAWPNGYSVTLQPMAARVCTRFYGESFNFETV